MKHQVRLYIHPDGKGLLRGDEKDVPDKSYRSGSLKTGIGFKGYMVEIDGEVISAVAHITRNGEPPGSRFMSVEDVTFVVGNNWTELTATKNHSKELLQAITVKYGNVSGNWHLPQRRTA